MADVFLSYAREEQERADGLAAALQEVGWSVFWDLTIPAGQNWDDFIGTELDKARCIVVAWSAAAARSEWVREEAREGKKRKILIPVLLEDIEPPFGFRGMQAVDLSAWDGKRDSSAFRRLVTGITRILGPRSPKEREAADSAGAESEGGVANLTGVREELMGRPSLEQLGSLLTRVDGFLACNPGDAEARLFRVRIRDSIERGGAKAHFPRNGLAAFVVRHRLSALAAALVLVVASSWAVWKVSQSPGRGPTQPADVAMTEEKSPAASTGPSLKPSARLTRIDQITWRESGGLTEFRLVADGAIPEDGFEVVRIAKGLPREVIKIFGVERPLSLREIGVGTALVDRVRSGLHRDEAGSQLHIIFDLTGPQVNLLSVERDGNVLLVVFRGT